MNYLYAMINRPARQAAPTGWHEVVSSRNSFIYGVVGYDRKLTAEELFGYEMAPLSPAAQLFDVGDEVIVNDVDEGVVTGYLYNGIRTFIVVTGTYGEAEPKQWVEAVHHSSLKLIRAAVRLEVK